MKRIPSAFSGSGNDAAIWERKPSPSAPLIYLGTSNGELISYNPKNGMERTVARFKDRIFGIVECGGLVYCSTENALHTYNPQTGEQNAVETPGMASNLTELDGTLYFKTGYGLYSFSPGVKVQKMIEVNHFTDCINKCEGKLYFSAYDELHSYNPKTRRHKKITKFGSSIDHIAGCNGVLYLDVHQSPPCYPLDPFWRPNPGKSKIYSYNPKKSFRKQELVAEIYNKVYYMAECEGVVYFADNPHTSYGTIHSYDPEAKEQRPKIKTNGHVSNIVKCGSDVYVVSSNKLWILRAGDLKPTIAKNDYNRHVIVMK